MLQAKPKKRSNLVRTGIKTMERLIQHQKRNKYTVATVLQCTILGRVKFG